MWPFCYVMWPKKVKVVRYSFIFAWKSSMTYFHETWQVWTLGGPVYIEIVSVDLDLFFKVIDPFSCRNSENKYCHNFCYFWTNFDQTSQKWATIRHHLYEATWYWWPCVISQGHTVREGSKSSSSSFEFELARTCSNQFPSSDLIICHSTKIALPLHSSYGNSNRVNSIRVTITREFFNVELRNSTLRNSTWKNSRVRWNSFK